MIYSRRIFMLVVPCVGLLLSGCASSKPDTTGFANVETVTLDASYEDSWQAAKRALRDLDYLIYTRDKRGLFMAFTKEKRRRLVPERKQITILVERVTDNTSKITLETILQRYGVTMLTYPGWHDRETDDNSDALAIIEGIESRLNSSSVIADSGEIPEAL